MDTAAAPVDELAGMARLVGGIVDHLSVPVQETHQGIASRVFGILGPIAAPIRLVHDSIAALSYGGVRVGARLAGGLAGSAIEASASGRDRRPITANPRGALAISFVNGLIGSRLDGLADQLVIAPTASVGRGAGTTDRMVVFVHGLAQTPVGWSWWADEAVPYPDRLEREGWTSVQVSYHTGRPIADSGADLASLIAELIATWPTAVKEIALVGHSMGGLVVRAACSQALTAAERSGAESWIDRVTHVVTLGSPHSGSWLARAAHRGAELAARLPETRGLSTFLELRSEGIRDLTHGWLADRDLAAEMPGARHAFVSAGLGSPIESAIGDGLVHQESATAAASSRHNVIVRHHDRVGHIRLGNHGDVGDDLVSWLRAPHPSSPGPNG